MKRFCIAAFLAALWMTAGCRLFEPEPQPVVCYPMSSYCSPSYSSQTCAPVTATPCVPVSATPVYPRPSGAAPGQLNPMPSTQGYSQPPYRPGG
jgi:hypothetical protein